MAAYMWNGLQPVTSFTLIPNPERALATTGHGMCPHSFYLGGGLPDSDAVGGEYVLLLLLRGGVHRGIAETLTSRNPNSALNGCP